MLNCAYRLLTDGVLCDALLDEMGREPQESSWSLDSASGMFLWSREQFFWSRLM